MSAHPKVRFGDRTTPPHIMTLVMLAALPAAAMNVYLPSLQNMALHFDTPYRLMQLTVALYLAVNAVLQLVIGPISDRYGRRPVLLFTIIVYCLFTLGLIYAPNVEVFLFCRMGQAVVVAGLVLSRAIVRDMVPQNEAAGMIGLVTMGMALVPMFAPAVGGALDHAFGWHASFWLLFVFGIAVLVLAYFDLGETASNQGLTFREQLSQAPGLFASPRFWGYNLAAMFASGAFFAYLGGAPFVGSEVHSLAPRLLGVFLGAPAIGYIAGNACSAALSARLGVNTMALAGACLVTAGLSVSLLLHYAGFETVWTFFGFMVFVGLGNGLILPNCTAGMLSVRPKLAGTASGLGGAMMIGGGAALSAFAGALLTPGAGALPLLWMMLTTSTLSVFAVLFVIWRDRQLKLKSA